MRLFLDVPWRAITAGDSLVVDRFSGALMPLQFSLNLDAYL
jgi:hypothetical protein